MLQEIKTLVWQSWTLLRLQVLKQEITPTLLRWPWRCPRNQGRDKLRPLSETDHVKKALILREEHAERERNGHLEVQRPAAGVTAVKCLHWHLGRC